MLSGQIPLFLANIHKAKLWNGVSNWNFTNPVDLCLVFFWHLYCLSEFPSYQQIGRSLSTKILVKFLLNTFTFIYVQIHLHFHYYIDVYITSSRRSKYEIKGQRKYYQKILPNVHFKNWLRYWENHWITLRHFLLRIWIQRFYNFQVNPPNIKPFQMGNSQGWNCYFEWSVFVGVMLKMQGLTSKHWE